MDWDTISLTSLDLTVGMCIIGMMANINKLAFIMLASLGSALDFLYLYVCRKVCTGEC